MLLLILLSDACSEFRLLVLPCNARFIALLLILYLLLLPDKPVINKLSSSVRTVIIPPGWTFFLSLDVLRTEPSLMELVFFLLLFVSPWITSMRDGEAESELWVEEPASVASLNFFIALHNASYNANEEGTLLGILSFTLKRVLSRKAPRLTFTDS